MKNATIERILNHKLIDLDLPALPAKHNHQGWEVLYRLYFPEMPEVNTNFYNAFSNAYVQIFRDGINSLSMLQNRSEAVRSDKRLVYHVVSFRGSELKWAVYPLQNDKKTVLAAVEDDCNALAFASPLMQDDGDVVFKAIANKRGWAIQHASPRLKENYDMRQSAVEEYGLALEHIPSQQRDLNLSLRALRSNLSASLYCTENIRKTPEYQKVLQLKDYQERHRVITFFLSQGLTMKNARKTIVSEEINEPIDSLSL
ncbi:DUF4116 domain-containing protein [Legionella longbeachae]|uniref:DUF4116 domain-containing protein n=1 Tax=Legionella longbeachae TaxID=450 RepID=UPI001245C7D2|nr:DUF4116 domain-containing protein [Legionella longbeachae]QEY51591.1 hypothetical protein FQU71_10235 [Legionella longbeachae]